MNCKKIFSSIWGFLTAGRLIVGVYGIAIITLAILLPSPDDKLHYTAFRCLGAGTRIENLLLLAPAPTDLEDRLRLASEHDRLLHRYLKHPVAAGGPILPEDVLVWPRLNGAVAPFELDGEPDWMFMNEGTAVEIWVGDALKTKEARILAVVGVKDKEKTTWQALLAESDLNPDSFGTLKTKPVLRVKALPGAAAGDCKS